MLSVVSPLENGRDGRDQGGMDGFAMCGDDDFPDFSDENLLDSIDFDDLFVGMDEGGVLPALEMDPEILAEFSVSGGEEYSSEINCNTSEKMEGNSRKDIEEDLSGSGLGSSLSQGDESDSKRDEPSVATTTRNNPSRKESNGRGKPKSSSQSQANKNPQGKRKVKVDWTPELHRRFVQAVEQLGVDKAVPSRILELMGIDCLTRHNIASHLQKYRSHKKHLLAREAEAANWSKRRQMYGGTTAAGRGGTKMPEISPWVAPPPPTMGFPPMTPVPTHFRPLHVWGHPSMDRSHMHAWPKHIPHSPSPPLPVFPPHMWAPPPPSPYHHPPPPAPNSPFWHSHRQQVPNSIPPGAPYFPQPLPQTRFGNPHLPVPGIPPPPHTMYKLDSGIGVPTTAQSCPHPPAFDFHPSNDSIDAVIGDILSKPWQPLPLGLKPPALDSVLVELQRQGIQKIPPTCV